MTSKMSPERDQNSTLTTRIVEEIADHRGIGADDPDFCLYEDTDPEALELLVEGTNGPLTTNLQVDGTCVTVEKTTDGEIGVKVESVKRSLRACD